MFVRVFSERCELIGHYARVCGKLIQVVDASERWQYKVAATISMLL